MRHVRTRSLIMAGLLLALLLAGVGSFYASSHPDGLSYVAAKVGISTQKAHPSDGSPFADYAARGITNERLSGGLAGVVGVLAVGALGGGLAWVVRRRGTDTAGGGD